MGSFLMLPCAELSVQQDCDINVDDREICQSKSQWLIYDHKDVGSGLDSEPGELAYRQISAIKPGDLGQIASPVWASISHLYDKGVDLLTSSLPLGSTNFFIKVIFGEKDGPHVSWHPVGHQVIPAWPCLFGARLSCKGASFAQQLCWVGQWHWEGARKGQGPGPQGSGLLFCPWGIGWRKTSSFHCQLLPADLLASGTLT